MVHNFDQMNIPLEASRGLLELRCAVQHYEWGGFEYIQHLIQCEGDQRPYAELWIGAHPNLPSDVVIGSESVPLNALIEELPVFLLGGETTRRFNGNLPFLFKVLSARYPLSIQSHPNAQQAHDGFLLENAEGIALDARNRNYKDDSHKPELISALTDFYALCGFKPLNQISSLLHSIPEFGSFAANFVPIRKSLVALYTKFMELPQTEVDRFLSPFVERLKKQQSERNFGKDSMEYWVLKADEVFSLGSHKDRGLFSVCLLNLIHLHPGDALYLPAGELHAYLEGSGIEIMANSNNVLRGGLTQKHVDVGELLKALTFNSGYPEILKLETGDGNYFQRYQTPAEEFELGRIHLQKDQNHICHFEHGVHIMIVIEGRVSVLMEKGINNEFSSGQVFLVPANFHYELVSNTETIIYLAQVPNHE